MAEQDPLIGKKIGKFSVTRRLGKGGMATVYEATQPGIRRTVAVKVLPRTFLHDDTFMARFRREAEVIASLEHFHILPIYDYGEDEGAPYIVMRYMEGGTLQDIIEKDGPVPWRDTLRITNQIAKALDYAHRRGIIHRDIKPSNIMLDADANAYLSDFGIARIMEGTANLTGSAIVGTPTYMAPEQSEPGEPTPQMDIYALGVTLFEMMTGQVPYQADTPIAQIMAHLTRPVPSLVDYIPGVSPAVNRVIQTAMAKDPADRYQTAGELANALEQAANASDGWALSMGSPDTMAMGLDASTLASPVPEKDATAQSKPLEEKQDTKPKIPLAVPIGGGIAALLIVVILGALFFNTGGGDDPLATEAAQNTAAAIEAANADATATESALVALVDGLTEEAAAAAEAQTQTAAVPTATNTLEVTDAATATEAPTEEPTPTAAASPTALPALLTRGNTQMILVPSGPFTMGNNSGAANERPEHEVTLSAFYIAETEVTNEFYRACVEEGVCDPPLNENSRSRATYFTNNFWDDYPVIDITWFQAQQYCEWRNPDLHLPTEAQWEKAARYNPETGTSQLLPWSADLSLLDGFYLNYDSQLGDTTPVRDYPEGRSPVGVYNMSGNVSEWVWDWFQRDYYEQSPGVDPTGPAQGEFKLFRGGSYESRGSAITTTFRDWISPDLPDQTRGFRCAYTPAGGPHQTATDQ